MSVERENRQLQKCVGRADRNWLIHFRVGANDLDELTKRTYRKNGKDWEEKVTIYELEQQSPRTNGMEAEQRLRVPVNSLG